MRVDPVIAALDNWRAETGAAQALGEFEKFGEGAALEDCPALEAVFTLQGQAEMLMGALVRHFCAAIAANPLGHPPFRNSFDGRASTMLLAKSGAAQMLLQAREPGAYDYPCATYSDTLRYDATLAGSAQAKILRIHGPLGQVEFSEEPIAIEAGGRLAFDCASEMLLAEHVDTRLVTLRLLQAADAPEPVREYSRESGALLHQSAGSLATSRREMMTALLGRMGRTDAAPVLADLARGTNDDSLRWQALRECLALDTARGFSALLEISRTPQDPLNESAAALRAQLIETHPQLSQLEDA